MSLKCIFSLIDDILFRLSVKFVFSRLESAPIAPVAYTHDRCGTLRALKTYKISEIRRHYHQFNNH